MGATICKNQTGKKYETTQEIPRISLSFPMSPLTTKKQSSLSIYLKNKFSSKKTPNTTDHYVPPEDMISQNETTTNLEGSPSMRKIQAHQSKENSLEKFKIYINPVKKYQMGQLVGNGPHGSVNEALSMSNGEQVAIKKVMCRAEHIDTIKLYLQKKLLDIDHFNLVNYIEVEELENYEINIVSELISGSSLESVLSLFGKLKENVCKLFIEQILRGLEHLHQKGSYHGNLKPQNIFIDKNGKVKLGDFFIISRKMIIGDPKTGLKTKPICYLAPEYIKDQTKSSKTDIWALGCILLEMLTKEKPWKHNYYNISFIKDAISNNKPPEIPKNLTELCKNFIKKMLQIKEEDRASIQELLIHPFIRLKEGEEEKTNEKIGSFKRMITFTQHNNTSNSNKKAFTKSKSNQQMLFVKLKTVLNNNKDIFRADDDFDKKLQINNEKINKSSTNNTTIASSNNVNGIKVNGNNPNKMFNRMTTAEIRKKNEEERKKFEQELLNSLGGD